MLGDKDLLHLNVGEKQSFMNEIQQSNINEILEEKQKEIKALKKTIKKLNKQLKEKTQTAKQPLSTQGANAHFKILLERQFNKCNQLKEIIYQVTDRIKKLTQDLNQEFTLSQNSQSMENLVKMLQNANFSGSGNGFNSSQNNEQRSSMLQNQQFHIEQVLEQFQIITKGMTMKHNQTKKYYKQSLHNIKHLQQQLSNYKKQLKNQRKSKDLLQKLLQKNETQKNQLVNQINSIASQNQIDELKSKKKQQILSYCFKLNYRIKDLQKEKQDYIKSSTRDKQKQMKLYQSLLSQVKGIKERSRIRQSVA